MRALEWTQILGQPCEFQVEDEGRDGGRGGSGQPTQGDLGASMRAYPHSDGDTMLTVRARPSERLPALNILHSKTILYGAFVCCMGASGGFRRGQILGHDHADGLELLVRGPTVADDRWVEVPHITGESAIWTVRTANDSKITV